MLTSYVELETLMEIEYIVPPACWERLFSIISLRPLPTVGLRWNLSRLNQTVFYNTALLNAYICVERTLGWQLGTQCSYIARYYLLKFSLTLVHLDVCVALWIFLSAQFCGATSGVLVELLVIKEYMEWKEANEKCHCRLWCRHYREHAVGRNSADISVLHSALQRRELWSHTPMR